MRKSHIIHTITLLSLMLTACVDDAEKEIQNEIKPMSVGITVRTMASESAANGYETGNQFENYIDVSRGDYRIYFFDGNDKYIAKFGQSGFAVSEDDGYTTYNIKGEVSQAIVNNADHFKIVFLANWGTENYTRDEDLKTGITTISDICEPNNADNPNLGKFGQKTDFELSHDNLLPFYGVREYENKQFQRGEATLLYGEPITLLRAMAKVEVILDLGDDFETTFSDVRICNYNERGYCAPYGVTTQGDYQYGKWSNDNIRRLHLVNASNDGEYKEKQFLKVQDRSDDNTIKEKWVAYLHEYDNSGDDYSYIEVKLNERGKESGPYKIYFADYTGGYTENAPDDRYDIQRNTIYRFKVRLRNGKFEVTQNSWDNIWENDFEFGTNIDEEE
ncbi:MAG: hypothetical protein LUC91_07420 [Prevotella sp.]|nr:hypothetical protein [Prevotella sp.]